ncbi:chloride channel protein [Epilithonimonas lactis]|uniref:Chloride channel protein n=1 Tax=Epilithonimonas lactis TaxID=421072 RepID=A0A085BFG4_9FLAO|nr:chloride channel protein [Epilithonimonas lactis]KFC21209.1 chloride channel protein [Epilithonimonas lactis]SEP77084.1 chloride channel protein, CIC family [Epilithonimonas lactis]
MKRQKVQAHNYFKLITSSLFIAIIASFLALSLKKITEFCQEHLFEFAEKNNSYLFIILPTIGITAIYFLRKYLFKNRKNKGITEIYKTVDQRKDHLPFFKIPSHYFNGFLTVIFGGSTGIEVSTVVATATVGNSVYEKEFAANVYKLELICAGVVAGVGVLFGNPLVGFLFALEVIARKFSKTLFISCSASALLSWLFLYFFPSTSLISLPVTEWHWVAIPFMVVLSLLSGTLSVYFTFLVIKMKEFFSGINNNFIRVNLGALAVGTLICIFPFLYGDSYHSLNELIDHPQSYSLMFLFALILLKPLASSLTLGAGGDGGVFAPSIVVGAYLGLAFAIACNTFFGTSLILINFVLIGIAATLSAAIYAPFTALILTCSLVPNGYALFFPILLGCILAQKTAQRILPYNVYTYAPKA